MSHIAKRLIIGALVAFAIGASPAAAQGRGANNCAASDVYWTTNGYGTLDYQHVQYNGYLICTLFRAGYIAAFDAVYTLAQGDANVALTNLAAINYVYGTGVTQYNGTAYGSPTFTANNGYTGVDGSTTVYIDTGITPSASTNFGNLWSYLGVWSNTNVTPTTGGVAVGSASGGCVNGGMLSAALSTGHAAGAAQTTTQLDGGAVANSSGWFEVTSSANGGTTPTAIYQNGTQIAFGYETAGVYPSNSITMLACDNAGSITLGDPHQIAIVMIGGGSYNPTAFSICSIVAQYMNFINGTTPPC